MKKKELIGRWESDPEWIDRRMVIAIHNVYLLWELLANGWKMMRDIKLD